MPAFSPPQAGNCAVFKNIDEMDNIEWVLPADLQPGRYRIQARFCDGAWPLMPRQVQTPEFEIKKVEQAAPLSRPGHAVQTSEGSNGTID
jgi:hypothetical protein